MEKETLEALKGSIAKWEAIVAGTGGDRSASNCPLCAMFSHGRSLVGEGPRPCDGCPVAVATGAPGCGNSPYETWDIENQLCEHDSHHDEDRQRAGFVDDCPDCLKLATAELDFLKSLLPKGEP